MLSHTLADLVLTLHLFFIFFVVGGGLLVLWRKWMAFIHLPAAIWGATIEFQGWLCPLTLLENSLRGDAGYGGTFIEHYLLPVVYPTGLTRDIQLLLGMAVVLINLLIYSIAAWRWRRSAATK
jgi:hypothetical protein